MKNTVAFFSASVGQDVRTKFASNNACQSKNSEWIRRWVFEVNDDWADKVSFHPNEAGQIAYAIVFAENWEELWK